MSLISWYILLVVALVRVLEIQKPSTTTEEENHDDSINQSKILASIHDLKSDVPLRQNDTDYFASDETSVLKKQSWR